MTAVRDAPAHRETAARGGDLTGVGILLRSHLRRDRWMILAWSLGGALLYWSQGVGLAGVYRTQDELDRAAASLESNAAFIAMLGPARALDTVGGQIFWQSSAFGAVVAGLMSMFLVGRHTRAEEESGRDELVRSGAVGRHAPLVAAALLAGLANVVLGATTTVLLLTIRDTGPLAGLPLAAADDVATGVGLAACGWVFTGVALAAAQLTRSTRAMYGIAGIGIGAAYLLRAAGDLGENALTWLSPIGWYQAMYPYSGLRWWPLGIMVVAGLVNLVIASLLFERRDVGSGLLADRAGPAGAGAGLRSSIGLAWRLQRGAVIGWTAALAFTGLAYGAMGDSVEDLLGDSEFAVDAMAGGATSDLVDGFYSTAAVILALIGAGFAISSAIRPRAEESAQHLEALLATGLDRSRWLAGHVAVTVLGTVAVLTGGGLGMGAGYAVTTGDGAAVLRYTGPTLLQVAPVLVLSGLARLLYGLRPRLVTAAWAGLAFAVVVLMFGEVLQFPEWLQDVSPFHHLPLVPAEDADPLPVLVVGLVAAGLSAAGQMAFRRRDIG
ncbi:ABC transporter permease [Nocardioides sambongensis]|uniref:ABC transporter permease n=1 Tax=Nocardioides sambongensis TaxID=2589074 RepID=UPI00112D2495|nr:ABC transporter permease [Nocardioides sambongensis]